MDNRRVAKVYRSQSQRVRKTPLPASSGGLFSRVKRYLSSSGIPSRIASLAGGSGEKTPEIEKKGAKENTNEVHAAAPAVLAAASPAPLMQNPQDPNRILSSFFQEKGSSPLSQVEYEGVMSLLDRSKASITLPLPESTPQKAAQNTGENEAQNETKAQMQTPVGNSTFAQYEQKKLRRASGWDTSHANNTSLSVADYRPAYHTFHEGSRSNISMKRVYPFSGVPSPYATRIQVPNLAARKARRVASSTPSATLADADASLSMDQKPFKPKSRAANSLLSILDGNDNAANGSSAQKTVDGFSAAQSKPLHNPYTKPKRFTPVHADGLVDKESSLFKPEEIQKTIAFDKSQPLAEEKSEKKAGEKTEANSAEKNVVSEKTENHGLFAASQKSDHSSLFGNSKGSEAKPTAFSFGNSSSVASEEAKSNSAENGDAKIAPVLSGSNTEKPVQSFSFGAKEESAKPSFSFGAKSTDPQPSSLFGSKPALNFGPKETPAPSNAADNKATEPKIISLDSDDEVEEVNAKPSINFGNNPVEKPLTTAPLFSFGAKPADANSASSKPTFSFGAKSVDKPGLKFDAKSPESNDAANSKPALNFSSKPATASPLFSFGQGKPATEKSEETPSFSFGAKSTDKIPAINFGAKPSVETVDRPAFSFGKPPADKQPQSGNDVTVEGKKPAFSFGAQSNKSEVSIKPTHSFGVKPAAANTTSEKPSFSFGKSADAPSEKPSISFGKPAETPSEKPTFSFGKPAEASSEKPSISFGKPAEVPSEKQKPAFSFGKPAQEKTISDKPTFSFGATPATDKVTSEAPVFDLGAKPSEEAISDKPAFNFGAKQANEKPNPAFNFGAKPNEEPTSTKPAFTFGSTAASGITSETQAAGFGTQPAETKESVKSGFNFGSTTDQKKAAFDFGSKTNNAEKPAISSDDKDSKPTFSFGRKPTESADQSTSTLPEKPSFTFGAKKPAFNFSFKPNTEKLEEGTPSSVSGSEASDKPTKPAFGSSAPGSGLFSFGANSALDKNPSNSFKLSSGEKDHSKTNGVSSSSGSEKPTFKFGSGSAENGTLFGLGAKKVDDKPGFNFGGNTNTPKPAFTFGAKPNNGAGSVNGEKKLEDEFVFPEAPVQTVNLNQQKVKEYEDLFEF